MVMAKIKVSQATIDKIKTMGMTKALKGASGANPEMKEALTRMYGAKRVSAAGMGRAAANKAAVASRPAAKSADAARAATSRVSAKPLPTKKSGTTDPFARAVFGVGRAISNNGAGTSTRKPVTGKPSVGEKISAALSGKGVGNRSSAASVATTNAKRMGISVAEYNKRLNAKKSK
jgi:hypothetical protein